MILLELKPAKMQKRPNSAYSQFMSGIASRCPVKYEVNRRSQQAIYTRAMLNFQSVYPICKLFITPPTNQF